MTSSIPSPFASPPPPYSPEHPHIILDHEKLPSVMSDPPPPISEAGSEESPKPRGLRGKDGDIFHLAPSAAVTLLARYVELLVSMTGNVPPTPPPSNPATPASGTSTERRHAQGGYYFNPSEVRIQQEATSVIHHGGVDDEVHYATIARKFWCKTSPDITIEDYLFRIHRFCPLSTAVYLAASYYLHRISITDRIVPLTHLNAHRLVLAALRIAAKTLEDLSYPHRRFAGVGGLNDLELSKLEVSFCFLVDFDLKVDRATLESHVELLRNTVEAQVLLGKDGLVRAPSA